MSWYHECLWMRDLDRRNGRYVTWYLFLHYEYLNTIIIWSSIHFLIIKVRDRMPTAPLLLWPLSLVLLLRRTEFKLCSTYPSPFSTYLNFFVSEVEEWKSSSIFMNLPRFKEWSSFLTSTEGCKSSSMSYSWGIRKDRLILLENFLERVGVLLFVRDLCLSFFWCWIIAMTSHSRSRSISNKG